MRYVSHGILEKLKIMRETKDRSSANAINIYIGPPNMRYVSTHGILGKLEIMR